ncbi:MAG: thiamine pyrophosphate-dependent enzyme [Pseudomonadota bacterium]
MTEYLDPTKAFPHCPGCGHPHVLRALDEALRTLSLDPTEVSLVTDIGCVGLADALFPTMHTVHTLHGRSVAVAAGLYLGDRVVPKKKPLKTIVLVGDGGAGIGLLHFVAAAQMNADVTVLIHNNLVYGMTGGQHSVLTPEGLKTTTTPEGSPIPPLDLGAIMIGAGVGYYARTMVPGNDVSGFIVEAINHPGFACVEIHELCPVFATKRGGVTVADLKSLPERTGKSYGVVKNDRSRPVFFDVYRRAPETKPYRVNPEKGMSPNPTWGNLGSRAQVVIAGKAGEHVQTAATIVGWAAAAAGLYVTLRADNPVTQGTGFSISEITIAPEPIAYLGTRNPDLVLAVAPEGLKELGSRGLFQDGNSFQELVVDSSLPPLTAASETRKEFRKRFGPKNAALGALIEEIGRKGWWSKEAWTAAFTRLPEGARKDAEGVFEKVFGKENLK